MDDKISMAHEFDVKNDDISLLKGCINGNQAAWEVFVRRYSKLVYYSITKTLKNYKNTYNQEDVEDIFNTIFLSLIKDNYKKLRQFDPVYGNTISSWVRLISIRRTIDFLRTQRQHYSINDETRHYELNRVLDDNQICLTEMSVIEGIEQRETEVLLEKAVDALPSSDKLFIKLYYEKKLPPEQIADIMSVSVNTVYSKKNRIREKIKKILKEKGYIA